MVCKLFKTYLRTSRNRANNDTTGKIQLNSADKKSERNQGGFAAAYFIIQAHIFYVFRTADWNIKRPEIAKKNATTPTVPMEERQEGSFYCATLRTKGSSKKMLCCVLMRDIHVVENLFRKGISWIEMLGMIQIQSVIWDSTR